MSKTTEAIRSLSTKVRLGAPTLIIAGVTIVVAGAVAMRSSKPEVDVVVDSSPAETPKA